MKVKIVNKSQHALPEYQTSHSAGLDLRADLKQPIQLQPMERVMVPTGIYIALPDGYEAQIRPRSGLAWRHGITVLNTPGTVDADYRGEIKVVLINLSGDPYTVNNGDRIAQMIISNYQQVKWEEIDQLDQTERGEGGYGSTGK